jgi:hypothetical protein
LATDVAIWLFRAALPSLTFALMELQDAGMLFVGGGSLHFEATVSLRHSGLFLVALPAVTLAALLALVLFVPACTLHHKAMMFTTSHKITSF